MSQTFMCQVFKPLCLSVLLVCLPACRPSGTGGSTAQTETLSASQQPPQKGLADKLETLAQTYQIEIFKQNPPQASWSGVQFQALGAQDLDSAKYQAYEQLFSEEVGKYPSALIKLAGLKQVALVKELAYQGQMRAALPDFVKEILYLDVYRGQLRDLYQRHVVHHEFYHLLEEQVQGNVYYKDPTWAAFNPAAFSYGSGGVNAQSGPQYALVHPQTGFINLYSMSGLEEDKAEVFAALMLPAESKLLEAWSLKDEVLRKKIQATKAFFAQKVPAMNEAYWQALAAAP